MPNTELMRAWLCAAVNDVVGVEVGMRSIVTAATYPGRMDDKATLKTYLDSLRSAILWKLEGLDEWQLRWPMTSTGSNLLGIVKHLAAMEYGYLGHVFDRPGEELPWMGQAAEPNADLWATSDETVESVVRLYRRAVAHADETIASLDLDAAGHVPWWPQPDVTLHRVLVHLSVEVARHAGQVHRPVQTRAFGHVNEQIVDGFRADGGEHRRAVVGRQGEVAHFLIRSSPRKRGPSALGDQCGRRSFRPSQHCSRERTGSPLSRG